MWHKKKMIEVKKWLLLLKKPIDTRVSSDIIVDDTEDEKILMAAEVIKWDEEFKEWEMVVVWKYSLFKLELKWEQVYFVDKDDVLGTIKDNV
jgi:hypothetical protein